MVCLNLKQSDNLERQIKNKVKERNKTKNSTSKTPRASGVFFCYNKFMDLKRVGILRGGQKDNYENSLKKGGELISFIFENLSNKYKPVDILVDLEGIWHIGGLPVKPADLMHRVDVVWNASHPSFSKILEDLSIPHVGQDNFSSAVGKSRDMLQKHMKDIGVKMPRHILLPPYQEDFDGPRNEYSIKKAKEVFEKFSSPWIVRSFNADPDVGVHLAKTFPELIEAIEDISKHRDTILVEEFISGKNAFMHSVPGFRGEDIYVFPAGKFSKDEKERLHNLAKNIHEQIGARYYLKSNFVLNPKKGIYLTSVEFFPEIKKNSHFNRACDSVGAKMDHVLEHILDRAFGA